ncbi:MAG: beta strand repeat-containing protein, partial [Cyclonatronaceae bacterium]
MKTTQLQQKQNGIKHYSPPKTLLRSLCLSLVMLLVIGMGESVTGQVTVAEDDAGNYDPPAWDTSNNEGTGFEAWSFDTSTPNGGSAGRFIGSFSSALDTDNKSFGLFANSGSDATSAATRPFPKSLEDGDTFSVSVGVNFRDGAKGFDLRDASNNTVINFNVGSDQYVLEGTSLFSNTYDANTVITFTFTQNGNDVDWTAERTGGSTGSESGTISGINEGTIENIRFYNVSAGSNNDGGSGERNLYFNSLAMTSPFDLPPSTNASGISFSNTDGNSMDVSFTNGDGEGRIVVAREGSAVNFTPDNGISYTTNANANYGAGSEVGPTGEGNKVVFEGTGTAGNTDSFTLSGLQSGTAYHFAIYEYNDNGGTADQTAYLTVDTPTANNTTAADFIGTTGNGTDWSNTATWVGGAVPGSGDSVELSHTVTLDQDATVAELVINSGGGELNFDSNNRILTIDADGVLNNDGGSFDANNGTVVFDGAGSISGTITFNNLDVSGEVNPGTGSTVNGTLSLLSGGSITNNTPAYGSSSTLRYNTEASVNPGAEWPTGTTDNPNNVTLEGTDTVVSFGSDSDSRTIGGNLLIGDNTTLQLSSSSGGDLLLEGDWTNQGSFDANDRAVFFEGSNPQTVTNTQANGIEIDFLINNNSDTDTGLTINDSLSVIQLTNNEILNLGTNNLTVQDNSNAEITNVGTLSMDENTVSFLGAGTIDGETAITFNNLEIAGGVAMTTSPTIENRLVINSGGYLSQTAGGSGIDEENDIPDYASGATLVYTGNFEVNSLASGWGTSGNKKPDNVAVEGSGNLTVSNARSVSGQ